VTSRRRAEEAFLTEKDFADTLLDTVEAIILVLSAGGFILRSNRYVSTLCGQSGDQLRGRDWGRVLLAEADRPRGQALLHRALTEGAARDEILGLLLGTGGQRAIAWSAFVLQDGRGGPADLAVPSRRVVILGYDVTDLKEAQQRALQAERLAVIGQMMTGLAHESRNALQRSQASLEMLSWQVQDRPRAVELVGRLQKAQDDLLRLYEEVRSYAAPVNLRPAAVNLAEVWREAWHQVTILQPDRDAQLREETGRLNLNCRGDRFHLVAVFRNLFDNSFAAWTEPADVKARPGPIRVEVRCLETWLADRAALRIAVRDNGPGLNAEQRQNLFQPFYTTKSRGTGLGLAIAKRIIEAHGGQIAVAEPPRRQRCRKGAGRRFLSSCRGVHHEPFADSGGGRRAGDAGLSANGPAAT
jgi:signal transduction histidine kinase